MQKTISSKISQRKVFTQRISFRSILSLVLIMVIVLNNLFALYGGIVFAQKIVLDGNTDTHLDENGLITDIKTETISGVNGLNSFTYFNVDTGNTVNLHIPEGASNLINLVHGDKSYINGMLNSIDPDGEIGGNLFFLNPYGLVVGSEGSVNVGNLTAVTPTNQFMEGFFDEWGNVSDWHIEETISGELPLVESGVITVDGTINAIKDIKLSAGAIENTGTIQSAAVFSGNSPDFSDLVNANGLESGSDMVVDENGNIVITALDNVDNSGNIVTDGSDKLDAGNITIEAGKSIDINGDSLISARGEGLGSIGGQIKINAPDIIIGDIGDGTNRVKILADNKAGAFYPGGDINIRAEAYDPTVFFSADAAARININQASLQADNISLKATADAEYKWLADEQLLTGTVTELGAVMEGIDVGIAKAGAASSIGINSGAKLEAKAKVDLDATSTADLSFKSFNMSSNKMASVSFLYGHTSSAASVNVGEGAHISASDFDMNSTNNAGLNVGLYSISFEGSDLQPAVAVTSAEVDSTSIIDSGAIIDVKDNINITAVNNNDFSTGVTGMNFGQGTVGIAASHFTADTDAWASTAADLNTVNLEKIHIKAYDNTINNKSSASTTVGTGTPFKKIFGITEKAKLNNVVRFLGDKFHKIPALDARSGAKEKPKLAAAFSIVDTEQNASATTADGTDLSANNSILLEAKVKDSNLHNKASSGVESEKEGTETDPNAIVSLSSAVNYGNYKRHADAHIGNGSTLSSNRVGIFADLIQPYEFTWHKWQGASSVFGKLNGTLGLAGQLTGFANATQSTGKAGLAYSQNHMAFNNNATAYTGEGAEINIWPHQAFDKDSDPRLDNSQFKVAANTDISGVFTAGNISLMFNGAGGDPDAISAGGAYSHLDYNNNTLAYLGESTVVDNPYGNVSIDARSRESLTAINPTAGRGAGYGLNGIFSLVNIDNKTQATVGNGVSIAAPTLDLRAEDELISWSMSGAFNKNKNSGAGLSLSINEIKTDTRAAIGDRYLPETGQTVGEIKADKVSVKARTDGRVESISVGLAMTGDKAANQPEEKTESLENSKDKLDQAKDAIDTISDEAAEMDGEKPASPLFGIGISGSGSLNFTDINTEAYIKDSLLNFNDKDDTRLDLNAVNDTDINAFSGAAGLITVGNLSAAEKGSGFKVGVAGSVALNNLNNKTRAFIDNSSINGAKELDVTALTAGEELAIALGLEVQKDNTPEGELPAGQPKSAYLAGSVSISDINNDVKAEIKDSTITGQDSGIDQDGDGLDDNGKDILKIKAYDRTNINTGGGSLVWGGTGGIGAVVSYSKIANDLTAALSGSNLSQYDELNIHGLTSANISSGGGIIGYNDSSEILSLMGSIVVNEINNNVSAEIKAGSNVEVDDRVDVLARDIKAASTEEVRDFDKIIDKNDNKDEDDTQDKDQLSPVDYAAEDIFGKGFKYRVTESDSLESIAEEYNVTVSNLRSVNDLGPTDKIQEGQELLIPIGTIQYTVAKSDKLSDIAEKFGVGKDKLLKINGMTDGSSIEQGQEILIPVLNQGSMITTVAGLVKISPDKKSNNIGISYASSEISNDFLASIADSDISTENTEGSVDVQALAGSRIISLSNGVTVSGQFAGAGSITKNKINNSIIAEIADNVDAGEKGLNTIDTADLSIKSSDLSWIDSLAGEVTVNLSRGLSAGGAVAINNINNRVNSLVDVREIYQVQGGDTLELIAGNYGLDPEELRVKNGLAEDEELIAGQELLIPYQEGDNGIDLRTKNSTSLKALSGQTIRTLSAMTALGSSAGLSASVAKSKIANQTLAEINYASSEEKENRLELRADDTTGIRTISGAGTAVGKGALGAAVSVNRIGNLTSARVRGNTNDKSFDLENLLLYSNSEAVIDNISAGIAGSLEIAGAGSVASNFIDNDTYSYIDGGANVLAANNVAVIAESDDKISNSAGSLGFGLATVGAAASVTVNDLKGDTKAYISGDKTSVTALVQDEGDKLTVSQGELSREVDLNKGLNFDLYQRIDLKALRQYQELTGIVVNSSATHAIESRSASLSGGDLAIAATPNVSIIGGSTEAYIDAARLSSGEMKSANLNQSISIKASDHAYNQSLVGNLGGGAASVGIGVDVNVLKRDTRAYLNNASILAGGNTEIQAIASQGSSSLTAGILGGGISVMGTGTVGNFAGTTESYIKASSVNTTDLNLKADHENRYYIAAGAISAGGEAGAATFGVANSHHTTKAYIEQEQDGRDKILADGDLKVQAENTSEIENEVVSGAGAGDVAVAGNAAVTIVDNTTQAYIKNYNIGSNEERSRSLLVEARDSLKVNNLAGDIAAAGDAGVGAAAAVTLVDNTTSAYLDNTDVYTSDSTTVNAESSKDLNSTAISVGIGGSTGIGGNAAVILVGRKLDKIENVPDKKNSLDIADELDKKDPDTNEHNGTISKIDNKLADEDHLKDGENIESHGAISTEELDEINQAGKFKTRRSLTSDSLDSRTSAVIMGDSTINTGGDVKVNAQEKTRVKIMSGGLEGGTVGIGGSVGVALIHNNVEAAVMNTARITSSNGNIEITAGASRLKDSNDNAGDDNDSEEDDTDSETDDRNIKDAAINVNSWQGSAGLVTLGAAISNADLDSNVVANAARGTQLATRGSGGVLLKATDSLAVNTEARAYKGSAAEIGAVLSYSSKDGETTALIGEKKDEDDDQNAEQEEVITGYEVSLDIGKLTISSDRSGDISAYTQYGAVAAATVSGSGAFANEKGQITAGLGEGIKVAGSGIINIEASAQPRVLATAEGYTGSAANIGLSKAEATASQKVEALIGENSQINAESLQLAAYLKQKDQLATADSFAQVAGLGLLLGLNASRSTAASNSTVTAALGTASVLNITNNLEIIASNKSLEKAQAWGIVAGGLMAGSNIANASADNRTEAIINDRVTGTIGGTLTVKATGNDETYAVSTSGTGGVAELAAAKANTSNKSDTSAKLGGGIDNNPLDTGSTVVSSDHTARFNGLADSTNGAAVGKNGAKVTNDIDPTVTASILVGTHMDTSSINLNANNIVQKEWPDSIKNTWYQEIDEYDINAKTGSGGLVDGPAASSETDIDNITKVEIGVHPDDQDDTDSNAVKTKINVKDLNNNDQVKFSAVNDITATDKAQLTAGGAVEIARAESKIHVNTAQAELVMGENAELAAKGEVNMSAHSDIDILTDARSKTYGLAGSAQGESISEINSSNNIILKENSKIHTANADINLHAGRESDEVNLRAVANTDLHNKTAVPIKTKPTADASLSQNNKIELKTGSIIETAGDINLITARGNTEISGYGKGTDLYRKVLEDIDNFFKKLFKGKKVSLEIRGGSSVDDFESDVIINGTAVVGLNNKKQIVIDENGQFNKAESSSGMEDKITEVKENLKAKIENRLDELNSAITDLEASEQTLEVKSQLDQYRIERDQLEMQLADMPEQSSILEIGDITAYSGNINIKAEALTGSGKLQAPADAAIKIDNRSNKFLRIYDLIIPDNEGGKIYFNRTSIANKDDINGRNLHGYADFKEITSAANTSTEISVSNSFAPTDGGRGPDIFVDGDIRNLNGEISLKSNYGSIQISKDVNVLADKINIDAGRDIIIGYTPGFTYTAGVPETRWGEVTKKYESKSKRWLDYYGYGEDEIPDEVKNSTGDPIIAGHNVFIAGERLNINGLVQSGKPEHSVTIDEDGNISSKYANVRYNKSEDLYEIDPINIMGGYLELNGDIINTSNGELRVMDGYGTVDITNNTDKAVVLNGINTSSRLEGIIKITDTGQRVAGDKAKTTVYKRLGTHQNEYILKEYNNDNDTGILDLENQVNTYYGSSTTYQPRENRYYSWTRREERHWPSGERDYVKDYNPGHPVLGEYDNHDEAYWYSRSYTSNYNETDHETVDLTIHHHNVYASNPIKINFAGENTGRIKVVSDGDININGKLQNKAGSTILDSKNGYILQGDNPLAKIVGDTIELKALQNVGSKETPIDIESGVITARSIIRGGTDSSVYLNGLKGRLVIERVSGKSNNPYVKVDVPLDNLVLTAEKGISQVGYGNYFYPLIAENLVITTRHGSLGSPGNELMVDTGSYQSKGLTARAPGNIYINQIEGDLYLNEVVSENGSVNLTAYKGDIIDANPEEKEDIRTRDELLALWDEMQLRGERARQDAEETVKAYEDTKTQEYRTYLHYRDRLQPVEDNQISSGNQQENVKVVLSNSEKDYYYNELDWSKERVANLENDMTDEYYQLDKEFGGRDSYDPDWQYLVKKPDDHTDYDPAVYSEWDSLVSGSSWTSEELENHIGIGMMKEISDTRVRIEEPNLSGNDITLNAARGQIGKKAYKYNIKLNGRAWADLSDREKELIMAAERKDISFVSDDEIDIQLRETVDLNASGSINASAQDDIYLASEEDMYIDEIKSDNGDIRIKSGAGLYADSNSWGANVIGQDLILEAAQKSIGRENDPLLLNLKGILTARSGKDIYLGSYGDYTSPSLKLDTIYAVNHVDLASDIGIYNATDTDLNIRAGSLTMDAGADGVGKSDKYLKIGLDDQGELNLEAYGDVFIKSPGHNLKVGKIVTDGYGSSITLDAGADISIASSRGGIRTADGGYRKTPQINITAAGSILDADDDQTSSISSGKIILTAKNGSIGSYDNQLEVDHTGNSYSSKTAAKGVYLTETAGDLYTGDISADKGAVSLIAVDGDIIADNIKALSGRVYLEAKGNISNSWSEPAITANSIEMLSQEGNIGSSDNRFEFDSAQAGTAVVSATASGDIYLTEMTKNINIGEIRSETGDIDIISHGSILNGNENVLNLNGEKITLLAVQGSIGQYNKRLTYLAGEIDVSAADSIYLSELTGVYPGGPGMEEKNFDHREGVSDFLTTLAYFNRSFPEGERGFVEGNTLTQLAGMGLDKDIDNIVDITELEDKWIALNKRELLSDTEENGIEDKDSEEE